VIDHDNRGGRSNDQNIGYVAEYLTAVDIELKGVRMVGREQQRSSTRAAGRTGERGRPPASRSSARPNSQGLSTSRYICNYLR
jgi:hypothetical protein